MADHKLTIAAIVKYLQGVCNYDKTLSSDAQESLEVGIQCLEAAYGITENDIKTAAPLHLAGIGQAHYYKSEITEEEKMLAESLKREGNEHMEKGEYLEALDKYSLAINHDSKNAVYYCNRAAAYTKLNNHPRAIDDCKAALSIDPTYTKAYGRMGNCDYSLAELSTLKVLLDTEYTLEEEEKSTTTGFEKYDHFIIEDEQRESSTPTYIGNEISCSDINVTENHLPYSEENSYFRNIPNEENSSEVLEKLAYTCMGDHYKARDCYKKAHELEPKNESYLSNLHLCEEKVAQGGARGPLSMPDISFIINNPAFVNAATQLCEEPILRNMLTNIMAGSANRDDFAQAIQNIAHYVQSVDPGLLEAMSSQRNRHPGGNVADFGPGSSNHSPPENDKK